MPAAARCPESQHYHRGRSLRRPNDMPCSGLDLRPTCRGSRLALLATNLKDPVNKVIITSGDHPRDDSTNRLPRQKSESVCAPSRSGSRRMDE